MMPMTNPPIRLPTPIAVSRKPYAVVAADRVSRGDAARVERRQRRQRPDRELADGRLERVREEHRLVAEEADSRP